MITPKQTDVRPIAPSKPVSAEGSAVETGSINSSANVMPTLALPANGNEEISPSARVLPDFANLQHAKIYSPRQAPSAVTSENFLAARASLSPGFVHNAAHSNIARISDMYRDAPRFRNEIDILV